MPTLYCHKEESITEIIEKIRASVDEQVTLQIEPESVFWQNEANKAILEMRASEFGKKITVPRYQGTENDNKPSNESPASVSSTISSNKETTKVAEVLSKPETAAKRKWPISFRKFLRFPLVLVPIALVIVLLSCSAFAYGFYYLPKAEVTLLVSKKTIQKETVVTLRPDQETIDVENQVIPVMVRKVDINETQEFDATGTKTVGEKATGTITVYNWRDIAVQLPLGQVFTVNEDQEGAGFTFVATQAVTIDGRSVDSTQNPPTISPGTGSVTVEASDVGALYNLPENLTFTVDGYEYSYDGVQGVNAALFSGGSTEEITVVSATDISGAYESLAGVLKPKATEELRKLTAEGEKLIEEYIVSTVLSNSASKEADDEAKTFTATQQVQAEGYFYQQEHIDSLLEKLLEKNIPDGFAIAEGEQKTSTSYIGSTTEGFVQIRVNIEMLLIPALNVDELRSSLSGKRVPQAEAIISELNHVSEGEVVLWPSYPPSLQRMPFQPERISVTIKEE